MHIGDKAYYDNLNKEFEQYDVLLYELVALRERASRKVAAAAAADIPSRCCKTA